MSQEKTYKILFAFGTRPEIIKLAPLIKILSYYMTVISVNTGQHTTLLKQALETFQINPDYDLGCQNFDLLNNFCSIIQKFRNVVKYEKPDFILVQGDTLSTFATAFVAFMEKKPLIHLEAGLRSGNKFSPFPEEINRILTDVIADIYLVPTIRAKRNLLNEGKREDRIFVIGNTVIDALEYLISNMDIVKEYKKLYSFLNVDSTYYHRKDKVLITSHRRENIGEPLRNICIAVKKLSKKYYEVLFIWSLHKNPMVRDIVIKEFSCKPENIIITEALPYEQFILLMKDCKVILSDSGGVQEEAPAFKKPVLILRENTERCELVETGFGFLVGSDEEKILETFDNVFKNSFYFNLSNKSNPFGDGKATMRFLKLLRCEKFYQFVKNYPDSYNLDLRECKLKIDEFK